MVDKCNTREYIQLKERDYHQCMGFYLADNQKRDERK